MRRVLRSPVGESDRAMLDRIKRLERSDRERAALAAVIGVRNGQLNLDDEKVSDLIACAEDTIRRYIAIRDIVHNGEGNHGATTETALDGDVDIELDPFKPGWRLVTYEMVEAADKDDGAGDSE